MIYRKSSFGHRVISGGHRECPGTTGGAPGVHRVGPPIPGGAPRPRGDVSSPLGWRTTNAPLMAKLGAPLIGLFLVVVGSTHLRFGNTRVVEIHARGNPKVFRSPG